MTDTSVSPDTTTPETTGGKTGFGFAFPNVDQLKGALLRGDLALAFGVMTILVVLIMPMPPFMLDLFLAVSIIFSVLVLMTALFIHKPLEFSAFPTVLLIATMIRLALNLASTRLILSDGHNGPDAAGEVIEAFGSFVMGGNFVIGLIVFGILVIVNFVVITKGSGRIAEVAARFTLDAMPGKQMAIDADLSAGLIDEATAKARRKELEDESSFFGAMDGASKFVRGDAIAGLLITFINIIGGIIIGVAQMEMSFADAGHAYTLLTVGDGLVSQIPALIVSTAAGLLVSKAGVSGAADKALMTQLSGYPKALGMSSFVMIVLAMLPGIPLLPFLGLAGASGYLAWRAAGQAKQIEAETKAQEVLDKVAVETAPAEEPISKVLKIDDLRIELGYGLLSLIDDGDGADRLTEQIKALRRSLAADLGFIMPSVRLLDNMQIGANTYVIKVKEVEAGTGEVFAGQFMTMNPTGGQVDLPGRETKEPTFGLPATWIESKFRDQAEIKGYTVVDPATVVSTHLTEVIKSSTADLLSYADTQKLIDELPAAQQKLIDDIVPSQISVSGIQRVLQSLLAERISIRDLPTITEGIAEASAFARTPQAITEHVRTRLALQICAAHQSPAGYLPLMPLSPDWEQAFADALVGEGDEKHLAMQPTKLQEFIASVNTAFNNAAEQGEVPVMLVSPGIRRHIRAIIERFRPQTAILSQAEIHPRAKLKTFGQIA